MSKKHAEQSWSKVSAPEEKYMVDIFLTLSVIKNYIITWHDIWNLHKANFIDS